MVETGFFLSLLVKKVNNNKFSSQNKVISSQNNVKENMNKSIGIFGLFSTSNDNPFGADQNKQTQISQKKSRFIDSWLGVGSDEQATVFPHIRPFLE